MRDNWLPVLFALLTVCFPAMPVESGAAGETQLPDATLLVTRADEHMRGETQYTEMTMKVIRPGWTRETSLKSWSKGRDLMLLLITAPARDRGTAFLKRKTEVWNWLPSVEKVIKIPPSMMMQPWMGSDFTNDDLVKESSVVNDYTHTIESSDEIDGHDCWKIRLTPKPDAAVVWGKLFVWIDKAEPIELRVEYYDEDDNLVNVQTLSEIKELGGRRIPTVLSMSPVNKPGQSTVLLIEESIFDKPVDDSFFSEQQMKKIR
jgi:outer membrane lipoprotein-sorting protein